MSGAPFGPRAGLGAVDVDTVVDTGARGGEGLGLALGLGLGRGARPAGIVGALPPSRSGSMRDVVATETCDGAGEMDSALLWEDGPARRARGS